MRLRTLLSVLVLAALLPPIVLIVFAVWRAGAADQEAANNQFLAQSRNLSNILSSALDANVTTIKRLGSIELRIPGALAATAGMPSTTVQLATSDTPHTDEAGWHLTNLFEIDPGRSAKLMFSVDLDPANNQGRALELTMDPRDLMRGLRFNTRLAAPDTLVALVDGNGRVVSRSVDEDKFVGASVPTWDALLAVASPAESSLPSASRAAASPSASRWSRGPRAGPSSSAFPLRRLSHAGSSPPCWSP